MSAYKNQAAAYCDAPRKSSAASQLTPALLEGLVAHAPLIVVLVVSTLIIIQLTLSVTTPRLPLTVRTAMATRAKTVPAKPQPWLESARHQPMGRREVDGQGNPTEPEVEARNDIMKPGRPSMPGEFPLMFDSE
ncbi:hypothetical protein DCS_04232 [Drechmeria coniospora]|uniref:Uncharacterized protein n=1 Tax=Drechmeria coniospora TaxID=98403 RepID=A0A151GJD3_DRECN|nr:hypothetical protein DCS_04232 [Drechmeria coniospora]KYK57225.1 hypothetical protein DCS_04232 [Drechmeria coniospora]